jgi:hypothetical protein
MIRYFVGSDQYYADKAMQFYMTLKNGWDCCTGTGFATQEAAEYERNILLQEGYVNIMIFKVEEV